MSTKNTSGHLPHRESVQERMRTDQGIIIKRIKHLEADLQVVLFLRGIGKIMATAKGGQRIQSKNKGLLEPFTLADYQVYLPAHGVSARLIGGKILDSHRDLRYHIKAFELANRCCEVVDSLFPYRAHSEPAFDILKTTLKRLPTVPDPRLEWMYFVVYLLKALGHGDIEKQVSASKLESSLALVQGHLNRILPWPLKSIIC